MSTSINIVSGNTKSCGCAIRTFFHKERTGETYNGLKFLRRSERHKKKWWVQCYCGMEFETVPERVVSGKRKSCGCHRESKEMFEGNVYNGITLIEKLEEAKNKTESQWKLRCYCGEEFIALAINIVSDSTKSCGCARRTHGKTGSRIYNIWAGMKSRCNNPANQDYDLYGGRGITMFPEWENDFTVFGDWAVRNGYQENLTIDRINVDGNYEPDNCRWANWETQATNKTNNKSGCVGVTAARETKWAAHIMKDQVLYKLGRYYSKKEAIEARRQGEIKHWGKEYQDFDKILADLELDKGDGNNTN